MHSERGSLLIELGFSFALSAILCGIAATKVTEVLKAKASKRFASQFARDLEHAVQLALEFRGSIEIAKFDKFYVIRRSVGSPPISVRAIPADIRLSSSGDDSWAPWTVTQRGVADPQLWSISGSHAECLVSVSLRSRVLLRCG